MGKIKFVFVAICLFATHSLFAEVDMLGREVKIKNSQRLVFVGPGALRLGLYLGLEDRIVGIEQIEKKTFKHSPYREKVGKLALTKKPIIGEGGPGKLPSMEALIDSKADLIIATTMQKDHIELIEQKTKIPVFALSYGDSNKNLDDVTASLLKLGEITNKRERAKKLTVFMKEQERELKALHVPQKRVYVGGVSFKGAWGFTSTEKNYLPFELLGIKSIVGNVGNKGHLFLDLEKIVELNPQYVFFDLGGKTLIDDELKSKKSLFEMMDAFKENNTAWLLPFNFYSTNVENCFINAWQIAKVMGKDVHVDKKRELILKEFLGEY